MLERYQPLLAKRLALVAVHRTRRRRIIESLPRPIEVDDDDVCIARCDAAGRNSDQQAEGERTELRGIVPAHVCTLPYFVALATSPRNSAPSSKVKTQRVSMLPSALGRASTTPPNALSSFAVTPPVSCAVEIIAVATGCRVRASSSATSFCSSAAFGFRYLPVALSIAMARVAVYFTLFSAASAAPTPSESASAQLTIPDKA